MIGSNMDLALLVYGISLLDGLSNFLKAILFVSILVCLASTIFNLTWIFDNYEYSWNLNRDGTLKDSVVNSRLLGKKIFKWSVICLLLSGFLQIFLPTQKTAYTMVGAYAAQKVTENTKVQDLSGKVLKVIEQKLDGYIEDGLKEAEEKITKETEKGKKDER